MKDELSTSETVSGRRRGLAHGVGVRWQQTSIARAVLMFALSGLAVLFLVGIVGVLVLRRVGTAEATREAADITTVAGRGVVQPALRDGIVTGEARSLNRLDAVVQRSVLRDPIVRVKIWDENGRIVYSDAPSSSGRPSSSRPMSWRRSTRMRLQPS
jgi:hypothetical protein